MKVLVVGLGNLGRRHAESLANSSIRPEVWGWDKDEGARNDFELFSKSLQSRWDNKPQTLLTLAALPPKIDLLVVSTTAEGRLDALRKVLNETQPRFVILEKPLTTNHMDLNCMKKLTQHSWWVNYPRRYSPLHQLAVRHLAAKTISHCHITVALPSPSLLSNASHFIDFSQQLLGKEPQAMVFEEEGLRWVDSKRPGFLDVMGSLNVTFDKDLSLTIKSGDEAAHESLCVISVESDVMNFKITEGANLFTSGRSSPIRLPGVPLQSSLTGVFLDELASGKRLSIPSFSEVVGSHSMFLSALERMPRCGRAEVLFT